MPSHMYLTDKQWRLIISQDKSNKASQIIVLVVILLFFTAISCGGDGDDMVETTITIKIGSITDLTGPGANGMELTNTALRDVARYYNENRIIPGVEFKIIEWDGQMDASRTVSGYKKLMNDDVDLITTCAPGVAITLEPRVNIDKMPLLTQVGESESIDPPGYVFCLGSIPQHEAYTFLKWIAENDWDYQKNGPAKIGAVAWEEPYASNFVKAMEEYADDHPDQFKFVEGYLTDFKFSWASEVELLKGCDYIFPPILVYGFAQDIQNTGSTAKLIGGTPHTAFLQQVTDAQAWDAIDGMIFIYTGNWWNETGEEIDFQKRLLTEYHHGEEEEIMNRGSGYQAITSYLKMFEMIANAFQKADIEDFDSEALYDAIQSYSKSINGRDSYSYTRTKRYLTNELAILEASAEQETLLRNDLNWYPIITKP